MKKTITVAAGLYPPDIGGPATYARMIEAGLPGHGFTIKVVPFGTVRHLPKIIRHLVYCWRLYKVAEDTNAIYSLDSISVGLPALLVARIRRVPLIVRLGGDYAWEQGRQRFGVADTLDDYTKRRNKQGFRVRILASLQDFVVSNAVQVIVPSQYLKSIVATWKGVDETKISVVYSALFPLETSDSKESLRKQFGYQGTVLVSAARLVPWKGFSVLLRSVKELVEKHDVTLVIAGDGPERNRLESEAKKLGVFEQVRFVGSLSKDALAATIKASDIFVLNTGYEGLSHQLLEVMDLGIPIVTTKVGGNIELIEDGVQGLLVPYNDSRALVGAVERLIVNPVMMTQYVQNARLRTKSFDQAVVQEELVNILNTII